MTTLITIGNLTKDAEVRTSNDGSQYVLLQIAENIYMKDEKGSRIKNANGHFEKSKTLFYSVFVNEKAGALTVSNLTKGQLVKVIGRANITVKSSKKSFDKYIIDSISAYSIDTNLFNNSESITSEITETEPAETMDELS